MSDVVKIRPRRNRKSGVIRNLVCETDLDASDLIYPLFIQEGAENTPIDSMPDCKRWSQVGVLGEIEEAYNLGVKAVVLFPSIEIGLKTSGAEESYNSTGLVQRVVQSIKEKFPEICVITDVALDPYNIDGHDGLVEDGEILNDETVEVLCKQALSHAKAGVDVVSPSDMMDGRVAAIRACLDKYGYQQVSILSYSAKYASAFYGPFRGALESNPKSGDKKTYQMDCRNVREAVREVQLDEEEGADMVMVKPAGAYLDVIRAIRESTQLPIAAYQVSGEYLMIKSASEAGWLDERAVVLESLMSIKRAGADMIVTYFAKSVSGWIKES